VTPVSPRIAVTVGDPRGIGPEVAAKVLADPPPGADYVVLGPAELVAPIPVERVAVGQWGGSGSDDPESVHSDQTTREAGLATIQQVERAVALALAGSVHAVVTGPAEKRALHLAGCDFPGHTEWLGALSGGVRTAMMLCTGRLRVVLVTTHIPLSRVTAEVTEERIVRVGELTRCALQRWWDLPDPRLAVCALNPHGGERGAFGSEDDEVLAPAARTLNAAGPLPADTVFVRALRGEFDAVLAPYHDVGMTAVKVAGFGTGVNVTLGLPFVRTAPDHGTAFDIAGRGIADAGSMREAVRLAVEIAGREGR